MADVLQRRGLHGVGLNEVLVQAAAPKGVLYHHFPGGKTELAITAIESIVERVVQPLEALGTPGQPELADAVEHWLSRVTRQLAASGFERGCPLATVALESTEADVELRAALASAFARLRAALCAALVRQGLADAEAQSLASFVVTGYEGALMQARVAGDVAPVQHAALWLGELIRSKSKGRR
jgi:TetR/AcrR family transcriptional repressor of lmrAB and yxaGH operons